MQSRTESGLITVQDALIFSPVSTSTLYGWVYQRRIPFVKVGPRPSVRDRGVAKVHSGKSFSGASLAVNFRQYCPALRRNTRAAGKG